MTWGACGLWIRCTDPYPVEWQVGATGDPTPRDYSCQKALPKVGETLSEVNRGENKGLHRRNEVEL